MDFISSLLGAIWFIGPYFAAVFALILLMSIADTLRKINFNLETIIHSESWVKRFAQVMKDEPLSEVEEDESDQ